MNESLHLSAVARLVEELLSSNGPTHRDRILLEAAFEREAAQAAAVWRRFGPGWRSVLERGPVDALPGPGQVHGVLDDELGRNLPGRAVVLHLAEDDVALVLGEVENPDGRVDLLEALLHLGAVVAVTDPGMAEGFTGPLPERDAPGTDSA